MNMHVSYEYISKLVYGTKASCKMRIYGLDNGYNRVNFSCIEFQLSLGLSIWAFAFYPFSQIWSPRVYLWPGTNWTVSENSSLCLSFFGWMVHYLYTDQITDNNIDVNNEQYCAR